MWQGLLVTSSKIRVTLIEFWHIHFEYHPHSHCLSYVLLRRIFMWGGGLQVTRHSILTSAIDGGRWSNRRRENYIPRKRSPYPVGRKISVTHSRSGRSQKFCRRSNPNSWSVQFVLLLLLLLLLLLTAIELSLGGSSPYTSTDKTNKNKYT